MFKPFREDIRVPVVLAVVGLLGALILSACSSAASTAPAAAPAPTKAAAPAPAATSAPAAPAATSASAAPAATPASAAAAAQPTQAPAVTVGPMTDVKPNKRYKIAYASQNESNTFVATVGQGIKAAAQKYGVDLLAMDNKGDVNQADINVDNAITQHADLLLEYGVDPKANIRIADKLKQANMKAIAIQQALPGFPFYVLDNLQGGYLGGEAVAKAAKAKWGDSQPIDFLVIGVPEFGVPFQERDKGAIQGAKSVLPNIKVTEVSDKADANTTRQVTSDFLTAHPNDKIMLWDHQDTLTLSALAAVKAAGRTNDVLIGSLAGEQSILPELRNPNSIVVGTVAFFPERWGNDLIPLAIKWLNDGTPPPPTINPPMQVLDRNNVDQWYPK